MTRSILLVLAGGAAALALISGVISIHASGGLVRDDTYHARWQASWSTIGRDIRPWMATDSSPGVCNKGGSKQDCYDTNAKVIGDLKQMSRALSGAVVPSQFRSANDKLKRAILVTVRGLSLLNSAFVVRSNVRFRRSKKVLAQGHLLFQKAYAAFPGFDRPKPAPIL
jgi:hypothetical protein